MSLEQTIRKLGAKGVSQPLEKDMNDQVHAGGYTSKNFEVSAPAQKMFASLPKDVDADKAEKSLQLHDKLFAIHKKTKATERSTDADLKAAQELHDQIMSLAKEMNIEDKHGHVKDSLEYIKKMVDKEGNIKDDIKPDDVAKRYATPEKNYQSDVKNDSDIDNMAKFRISRDKRAQRKLKIIDDQYNPGVNEMDRIENVSPSFLEALKKVQENALELEEKKKMTKADIAALKEPKGKFDEKDLAALRAGEHKKKVDEEMEEKGEKEESAAHEKAEKKMKKKGEMKEDLEQIDEALNAAHKSAITNHIKKMWGKGKVTFDHTGGIHTVSHSDGIQTHVHSIKIKGGKAHVTHFMDMDEEVEDVEEGVRSIRKATRTWADKKSSTDAAKRLSKKGFTPPGTPSKADMRKKGEEAVRSFLAKGRKITKEDVEEETLDEAQFIVIQKGMDKKRVRNNPVEIMKARKDGWAIQEDAETVEEGNEMKNLAQSQAKAVIKREVQQKKAMFAKKDSADKAKFAKQLAKEEFVAKAIAILGEDFKDATFEQLAEEIAKRGRGRPRKNPLPDTNAPKRGRGRPRKDAGSSSAAKPEEAGDREHIVMGLRKAISLRGEHGVKFADGSVHKIPAEHAQKALKIHDNLSKPSEKMVFQRKLGASHASFKKALEDKNPGGEETKKTGITLAKRAEM